MGADERRACRYIERKALLSPKKDAPPQKKVAHGASWRMCAGNAMWWEQAEKAMVDVVLRYHAANAYPKCAAPGRFYSPCPPFICNSTTITS